MPAASHADPHQLAVIRGDDFCVSQGANQGDGLSNAADLVLDDQYTLAKDAAIGVLAVHPGPDNRFEVTQGASVSHEGAFLTLEARLCLMSPMGMMIDALLFTEQGISGAQGAVFLHPFTPLMPGVPYALVDIDQRNARLFFAQSGTVSLGRGTLITLAGGLQTPVENLHSGDLIMTRDDGPQPLRWIGQQTLRATGDLAPVVISADALHNRNDLMLSKDQSLFIYQRDDHLGLGRAEVMIKAEHLVDDETITRQEGGFVEYFQLVFDNHQIIFAEGIAVETMRITRRNRALLPAKMSRRWGPAIPGHSDRPHAAFEIADAPFGKANPAQLLRRASRG